MEEDICGPGSPVLCCGVRRETSLPVGVILQEKLLESSVAQTLEGDDLWGSIFAEDSGVQKSGEIREVQEDGSWTPAFSSASHKWQEKYSKIIVSSRMMPEDMYTLLGTEWFLSWLYGIGFAAYCSGKPLS